MSDIFIPTSRHQSHPLCELLRGQDVRKFNTQIALSDALSRAVQTTARRHRLRNPEVLDGLLTALASMVQAMAPETEWNEISAVLADEIQRRLTVTGIR